MHQAWSSGQPSLLFSSSTNTSLPYPPDVISYHNYPSSSDTYFTTQHAKITACLAPPVIPAFVTPLPTTPAFATHPPIVIPGSTCATVFNIIGTQYYASKLTLKVPDSYWYIPQLKYPFELENHVKTEEHEEMSRKIKSLERSMKSLQALGGHRSVSYENLCMFPNVHFPTDFKIPKFDKYDGHGDPVAYLKRYCNQLRGAGGKQELLMAYFGESLTGLALEWFIDQDFTK
ncbi:uncharacterized protein LOC132617161 [Lycium barbarum]|uniref:uncharacterized protein LOC132617161 n=1 Tax=Lycium barbarum TaxID=112863 RepID=UPI00293F77FB|nr:uncharacterized protein LOC132617161 [Lycium barbarum]